MKLDSKPYSASTHNSTTATGITMTVSITQYNTITLATEVLYVRILHIVKLQWPYVQLVQVCPFKVQLSS